MKSAGRNPVDFGDCLLALVDADEFADPVDRRAAAIVLGKIATAWLKQNVKG